MPTISTLAVRLVLQSSGFGFASSGIAAGLTKIAGTSDVANQKLTETASRAAHAGWAFDKASKSARNYYRAIGQGAIGGVSLVRAITAGAKREQADADRARKSGGEAPATLIESWRKLGQVVNDAFAAFGSAFNKAAGLTDFIQRFAGTIQKLTPLLQLTGYLAGGVAGFFLRVADAVIPVIVAIEAFTGVLRLLLPLLTAWAVNRIIFWITGFNTRIILTTVLTWAWTAATTAAAAAMAVLRAISGPVWILIGVLVTAAVAALYAFWNVLKMIVAPFQWLWSSLTGTKVKIDTAQVADAADEFETARENAQRLQEQLSQQVRQFGWSEQKKQLADYIAELKKNGDITADEREARIADFQQQQQTLEVLKKMSAEAKRRQEAAKTLADMQAEIDQMGMSEAEKRLDDLRRSGTMNEQELNQARQLLYIQERKAKWMDEQKRKAEEAADLQRKAAEAAEQAAEKAAKAEADRLEKTRRWKEELARQGQALKDSVATPLEEYRKRMAEIGRLLALGAANPVDAMRAADAAGQTLEDALGGVASAVAESPKALLKGTAEAALAENRAKNPIERLTDVQKKQLEEARKAKAALDTINATLKAGKDFIANF